MGRRHAARHPPQRRTPQSRPRVSGAAHRPQPPWSTADKVGDGVGSAVTAPTHHESNLWFWLALPVGAVFLAAGVHGIVHQHDLTRPTDLARWFAGAGVFHDAVLAPAVVVVGVLTARLPAVVRVPMRVALAASALVVAFAWPLVRGWGRRE